MLYAAELELEVDRLRRREQFLNQKFADHNRRILQLCGSRESPPQDVDRFSEIAESCRECGILLRDFTELAGYHPAFDQVIAIALKPLIEKVFRWQQCLNNVENAILRLDLESEHMIWFPARLHHILDNLISNSLKYRNPAKAEIRIEISVRTTMAGYILHVKDNGLGLPHSQTTGVIELLYRAAPTRAVGLGVGLAIVKALVEQCCGSITITSGEDDGTEITVVLPRYDLHDYVDVALSDEQNPS